MNQIQHAERAVFIDEPLSAAEAARVIRILEEFSRANRCIDEHHAELVDRYPDRWIAITAEREVVAASEDPDEFVRQLDSCGRDRTMLGRRFMATRPAIWNLAR